MVPATEANLTIFEHIQVEQQTARTWYSLVTFQKMYTRSPSKIPLIWLIVANCKILYGLSVSMRKQNKRWDRLDWTKAGMTKFGKTTGRQLMTILRAYNDGQSQ